MDDRHDTKTQAGDLPGSNPGRTYRQAGTYGGTYGSNTPTGAYGTGYGTSYAPSDGTKGPGTPITDRTEERIDRAAAYVEGALEGFAEGMEKHRLSQATHKAIDQVDKLARTVRRETGNRPSRVAQKAHEVTGRAQASLEHAKDAVGERVEDIKHKAHAVAETSRRAAQAPGLVARDVNKAASAWSKGFFSGLAWMAGAFLFGGFALVLLTMGLVAALTPALGAAGAMFAVMGLYLVVGILCYSLGATARKRGQAEAQGHLERAKQDIRNVGEPVREAFGPRTARPLRATAPTRMATQSSEQVVRAEWNRP